MYFKANVNWEFVGSTPPVGGTACANIGANAKLVADGAEEAMAGLGAESAMPLERTNIAKIAKKRRFNMRLLPLDGKRGWVRE